MGNCLAGSISKYFCSKINLPIDSTAYAPFIKLTVEGEGKSITVGNQSSPSYGNAAVIKSMQVGYGTSMGVTIDIHDEQGGQFELFMDKLNKCLASATGDYQMTLDYGWIGTDCGEDTGQIILKTDQPITFMPIEVSAALSEGKIRFQVTGTSLAEVMVDARSSKPYRGSLKSAIQQLFADSSYPPVIPNVKFLRKNPDGTEDPWDFETKSNGPDGPIDVWKPDTQNKIAAAMAWLEPYRTSRGKGIRPAWEAESPTPTMVFWEDPFPKCGESRPCGSNSFGTFIVNGGSCSSVISFNPVAKWAFTHLHVSGGNAGSGLNAGSVPNAGRSDCHDSCNCFATKGTGSMTSIPPPENAANTLGPKSATKEMRDSSAEHDHAQLLVNSISAELRIQGNPFYSGNSRLVGSTCSVVVINPFYINSNGKKGCGDWLASPGVNPVYSNKAWFVIGADHNIREGSYVTTLKLNLPAPGSDIARDDVFGGPGSAGWKPPTGCST